MSQLDLVHTFVGNLEQRVGIGTIDRTRAYPEACADNQRVPVHLNGTSDCRCNNVGDSTRLTAVAYTRKHNDEFIATDPRNHIGAPDAPDYLAGNVLQHLI